MLEMFTSWQAAEGLVNVLPSPEEIQAAAIAENAVRKRLKLSLIIFLLELELELEFEFDIFFFILKLEFFC